MDKQQSVFSCPAFYNKLISNQLIKFTLCSPFADYVTSFFSAEFMAPVSNKFKSSQKLIKQNI